MTFTAIVLITIASFTHVSWNVLGKKRNPSTAFFFLACLCGSLLLLPFVAGNAGLFALVPPSVWGLLVLTGFCQALYFVGLACAYAHGHLSIAYPLARALPVLLVALVSDFTRQTVHPAGWAGMALIVAGALLLPVARFQSWHWRDYQNRSCLFALVAAAGTAGYSMTDDLALRQLRAAADGVAGPVAVTLFYAAFEGLASCLWLLPVVWRHKASRANVRHIVAEQRAAVVLTGLGIFVTYALVLVSMAYVRDVSYVVAFRQLSIPLGALAGIVLLREPAYRPKMIGVTVMFIGLVLAALF